MLRRVVAGMIAFGLGVGIWLLWPRGVTAPPTDTSPIADPTTTTTTGAPSTTLVSGSTTSTAESHVVETVEEAKAILRELWFGWFEGIYNQDEDRIREVVATEEFLNAAISAFGSLNFVAPPVPEAIHFDETEVLMSTGDCLVVWTRGTVDFLSDAPSQSSVDVLRLYGSTWKTFSTWKLKGDLWERDCEAALQQP